MRNACEAVDTPGIHAPMGERVAQPKRVWESKMSQILRLSAERVNCKPPRLTAESAVADQFRGAAFLD